MSRIYRYRRIAGNSFAAFMPVFVVCVCTFFLPWFIILPVGLITATVMVVIAGLMQRNPWISWSESGLPGVIEINSRGALSFHETRVAEDGAEIGGKKIPFFRNALFGGNLASPVTQKLKEKEATFTLVGDDVIDSRWAMGARSFFIYNSQTKQFMTKKFLMDYDVQEQRDSNALQLLAQVEKLNNNITYWARHILDQLAAAGRSFAGGYSWLWIVGLIILLVIGGIFLGPKLFTALSGQFSGGGAGFFTPR